MYRMQWGTGKRRGLELKPIFFLCDSLSPPVSTPVREKMRLYSFYFQRDAAR